MRYVSPYEVDTTLDSIVKDFVNSSEVLILPEENSVFVSEIFHWYRNVFNSEDKLLGFVKQYTVDNSKKRFLETEKELCISYLIYDWNLNN
ncbi:MAG: hypothetical protein Q9M89_02920 [Persephonella sp.]|nr:hypothetical protein [Persephonella sp.]